MLRFLVPNNSDITFHSLALLTVKRTIWRGRHCSRAELVTGSLAPLQLMHQTLVINMQLNSRNVPFLLIAHFNTEFIYLNIPPPPALLLPSDLFALANCCWQGSSSSYIFVTENHNQGRRQRRVKYRGSMVYKGCCDILSLFLFLTTPHPPHGLLVLILFPLQDSSLFVFRALRFN